MRIYETRRLGRLPMHHLLTYCVFLGLSVGASLSAASLNDLGLQQVIEVKKKRFSANAGYRFEVLGRSNPFYIEGPVGDAAKVPVMSNSAFLFGEGGNYGFGSGIMKHSVGIIWRRTSYLKELLQVFDHDTQTLVIDNSYYSSSRWAWSLGARGTRLVNVNDGITDYKGWSPNFSVGKLFQPSRSQHVWVRWRSHYSLSTIQGIAGTDQTVDRLNHWNTGLSLTHAWALSDHWRLDSHGGLDASRYREGANRGRMDTMLGAGTAVSWGFLRFFSLAGFVDYSHRFSNQGHYEFSNWDGGLRFNADIGF